MPKNLTDQSNTFYAPDREAWHAWLAEHAARAGEAAGVNEVWLIFMKQHTGQPCIDYEAAVEEALCFGWIDSLIQRIDDQRYARKFNVRKDYATWSESNRRRLRKLAQEGRLSADLLGRIPAEVFDEFGPRSAPARFIHAGLAGTGAARQPGGLDNLPAPGSVSPAHLFGLDHGCQTPGNARTAGGRSRPPPRAGPGIGIEVTGPAQLQVNLWYESTDVPIFPDMLPPPQPYAV